MRKNRRKKKLAKLAKAWGLYRLVRRGPYMLALTLAGALARRLSRRRSERRDSGAKGTTAQGAAAAPSGTHAVSLHRIAEGERFAEALEALRTQLGARAVRDPDEHGFFEVEVEAAGWDEAAARVRDAVAAAGADDAVELGEPSGRLD